MTAAEWGPADGFAVALLAVAVGLYTSLALLFALLTVPVGLVALAVSAVGLLESRADARRAAEWAAMTAAERAAVLRRYGADAERAAVSAVVRAEAAVEAARSGSIMDGVDARADLRAAVEAARLEVTP